MDRPGRLLLLVLSVVPPGMVHVPAGRFLMGAADGEFDEQPVHRVRLEEFVIDRTEVTAGAYRGCMEAGRCSPPRRPSTAGDLPVTWVTWRDAAAYCRFAGKRLPTEAEWERAARGDEGRTFPWGDQPDCTRANFGNYRGEGRCEGNPGRPEPVGKRAAGASPSGALDMAGNVWEWVADRYDPAYYARSPAANPRGPSRGSTRVVRGDGCCSMFGLPRTTNRLAFPEDYADEDLGFRCAR